MAFAQGLLIDQSGGFVGRGIVQHGPAQNQRQQQAADGAQYGTQAAAQGAEAGNAVVKQPQHQDHHDLDGEEEQQKAKNGSHSGHDLAGDAGDQLLRDLAAAALLPSGNNIGHRLGQLGNGLAAQFHKLREVPAEDGALHHRGQETFHVYGDAVLKHQAAHQTGHRAGNAGNGLESAALGGQRDTDQQN